MDKDQMFYKYYSLAPESIEYTLAAIEGNYIWATKPSEFSDPYDSPHALSRHFGGNLFKVHNRKVTREGINAIYQEIQKNRSELTLPNEIDEATWDRYAALYDAFVSKFCDLWSGKKSTGKDLFQELSAYIEHQVGICCFTTSPLNLFMWDKYASGYSGICAKYKFVEEIPSPVKYPENYRGGGLKLDFYETLRNPEILWESFFVKLPHYKEENEHRILYFTSEPDRICDPDGKGHRKFRGAQLLSLYFGNKTPPELVRVCCQLAPGHVALARLAVDDIQGKAHIQGFGDNGVPLTAKDYRDNENHLESGMKERIAVIPQYDNKHRAIPEAVSRLISGNS